MRTSAMRKVTFDLQSHRDSVNEVADRLSRFFDKLGWPDDAVFDVKLAAQEAVVNAVEHGNGSDSTKLVHISCETAGDAVTLVVSDEGNGFNPAAVPDPTLPENILREHGRGLFLMRNLCDEVFYNEKGNEITIIKRICRAKQARRRGSRPSVST